MATAKTITINGRQYDAATGMLVTAAATANPAGAGATATAPAASPAKPEVQAASPAAPRTPTAATSLHSTTQRSKTLNRRAAKKPTAPAKKPVARPKVGRHMDIARHANVQHFAAHPVTKPTQPAASANRATAPAPAAGAKLAAKPAARIVKQDILRPAQVHPTAQRALHTVQAKAAPAAAPLTPHQKKEAQIHKALSTAPKAAPKHKKAAPKKRTRLYITIAIIVVVLLTGAYAAYKIFPTISVGIAASQAGIKATYPEYTPDGYLLKQPVSFEDGQVSLTFKSTSNEQAYTITQERSSWDSSSVLDNVVQPKAGDNYVTTKERGLTIFTFGNSAAWMNGGILYTINGNAQLSGDQVRRIATSL